MNLANIFEEPVDNVIFVIDGERAYEHVMDKFGHVIEWDGDYMVAPRKVFNQIEELVYSAGGEVEEVTGFEHPLDEATGLTFMGSPCTKDCSGHKAGYEWSEKRGGQTANSHSQSFNNGAAISANQHKPKTPPKAQQPKDAADRLRDKQAELVGPDNAKTLGLAEELGAEFGQKELKHMVNKARAMFPRATSDSEALLMFVADKEQQDVRRLNQVNDREDKEIRDLEGEESDLERRLQNVERKLASVSETRLYYNVVSTPANKLRADFGLRKDKNGWYLNESAEPKAKYTVYKAFGSPKLKEYDLSVERGSTGIIKGADNPISPVGSLSKGQRKSK